MHDQKENTIRFRRVWLENNPVDVTCVQLCCSRNGRHEGLISMQERDGMQDGARMVGGSNETHSILVFGARSSPSERRMVRPPTRAKLD